MKILITGGIRSGKSAMAQSLLARRDRLGCTVGVVVFGRRGVDEEFDARIARHQSDRPEHYLVIEGDSSDQWLEQLTCCDVLMVDCIGTLAGLIIEASAQTLCGDEYLALESLPPAVLERAEHVLKQRVTALLALSADVVFVTNEVGMGGIAAWPSSRLFADVLGRANRYLVDQCDCSYLCIAGRAIALHELTDTPDWE